MIRKKNLTGKPYFTIVLSLFILFPNIFCLLIFQKQLLKTLYLCHPFLFSRLASVLGSVQLLNNHFSTSCCRPSMTHTYTLALLRSRSGLWFLHYLHAVPFLATLFSFPSLSKKI